MASSEFFRDGKYEFEAEHRSFTPGEFTQYLADLVARYPIVTHRGWHERGRLGRLVAADRGARDSKIQLVGDDLFVTNTRILAEGISRGVANAILIKPNQIGTLTETLAAIDMAEQAHYASIVSHRSGETEDCTIADIAVATAATQIKTGSMSRSDRIAKYNQLLRIEEALGGEAAICGPRCVSGRFEPASR